MSETIQITIDHHLGRLRLNRPQALNALSLEMIRTLTRQLLAWRSDADIAAVLLDSTSNKAFCAGGDIRFFHQIGSQPPQQGSALLEDFFTEEYALNHLIHHYPKPYVVIMDGIVMGGGMGLSQCFSPSRMRMVTERTKMAMPEVNIGLFPDIGASYFLSRCPGQIGTYLALTGQSIGAADALYAQLADVYIPSAQIPVLHTRLKSLADGEPICDMLRASAAPFQVLAAPETGVLAACRQQIDRHFGMRAVADIQQSLREDPSDFAQGALAAMQKRSPLMLCVTLEQLKRGAGMAYADCLRMERAMMRHSFAHGEALEGIRAAVIDKDQAPKWSPARLEDVSDDMVNAFFEPVWPPYLHPLRSWL